MNALTKNYVLDENQKTIAVQIPIAEFEHLEELLEDYGLLQLMSDPIDSDRLSKADALNYYKVLKQNLSREQIKASLAYAARLLKNGDATILSQAHLAQDWLTEIEDEAWQDL
jgi:hypothetical protein